MKNIKLWIGVAICIGILVGVFTFYTNNVLFVQDHSVDINIVDHKDQIGFNLDKDAIHFGSVQRTGKGKRDFNLTHGFDEEARVKIRIKGNISELLKISETDFYLNKGEMKQINLTIDELTNTDSGYYSGIMRVTFLKR